MPELDGLATLREIRKTYPKLPVIMFSSLTERGATATLDALALGATDYFTKPSGTGGMDESLAVIRDELVPEIKALCARRPPGSVSGALPNAGAPGLSSSGLLPVLGAPAPAPPASRLGTVPKPIEVVAIGTSTGGPNALADVFGALPADFPVPIVIVQHMPPMFT